MLGSGYGIYTLHMQYIRYTLYMLIKDFIVYAVYTTQYILYVLVKDGIVYRYECHKNVCVTINIL